MQIQARLILNPRPLAGEGRVRVSSKSAMSSPYDAVLLIAFGGPTAPQEIRPFLARVTKGIPIPPQRLEEVAHHYEAVGGKSPLNEITFHQAEALRNC